MANTNRNKGNNFEREVMNDLKSIPAFKYIKSTREASKALDNCGVDIANAPLLIQCKSGYNNKEFKYEEEFKKTKELLKLNFPPTSEVHNQPYVLIHKKNVGKGKKRTEEMCHVKISYTFFLELLRVYDNLR